MALKKTWGLLRAGTLWLLSGNPELTGALR